MFFRNSHSRQTGDGGWQGQAPLTVAAPPESSPPPARPAGASGTSQSDRVGTKWRSPDPGKEKYHQAACHAIIARSISCSSQSQT